MKQCGTVGCCTGTLRGLELSRCQEFSPGHISGVHRAGWPCQRSNPSVKRQHESVCPMTTPAQSIHLMQGHNLEFFYRVAWEGGTAVHLGHSLPSVLPKAIEAKAQSPPLQCGVAPAAERSTGRGNARALLVPQRSGSSSVYFPDAWSLSSNSAIAARSSGRGKRRARRCLFCLFC